MKLPASVGDHRIEFIWVRGPNGQARLVRKGGEDDMVVSYKPRGMRKRPVQAKIMAFMRDYPQQDIHIDDIAKGANLARRQASQCILKMASENLVKKSETPSGRWMRGYWRWIATPEAEAAATPPPPKQVKPNRPSRAKRPQTAPMPTPPVQTVAENGSQPFKEGDTIIMDVLRVREDGTVVFVDENRNVLIMRVDTVI